jgi:hypothetical protein
MISAVVLQVYLQTGSDEPLVGENESKGRVNSPMCMSNPTSPEDISCVVMRIVLCS